jgi:hypothetical protein
MAALSGMPFALLGADFSISKENVLEVNFSRWHQAW